MKIHGTWLLGAMLGWTANLACAQLQVLPDPQAQVVFGGGSQMVASRWHYAGDAGTSAEIHIQLLQASSATVVPVGETPWKQLQVLPGQTVLDSARLDFPAVKAETKFLVQWLVDGSGTGFQPVQGGSATEKGSARSSGAGQTGKMPVSLLGTTTIWVYPTNLLAELKPLLGGETLGVLDPGHELAPALKQNGVTFLDLGETPLTEFSGRLAILGPFSAKAQMPADLTRQIKVLAKRNVAVVWLLPPADRQDPLLPSFYTVPTGTHAVVIVQADMVSKLAENPQSQLHLIHFCRLALHPQLPIFPNIDTQEP